MVILVFVRETVNAAKADQIVDDNGKHALGKVLLPFLRFHLKFFARIWFIIGIDSNEKRNPSDLDW